jgi:hypothetical protein
MSEAPPPSYRRTLTGFEPVSTSAQAFHRETKLGSVVRLDGKRPRNLGRHCFYWKMLTVAAENLDCFDTPEQLHLAVKAAMGRGRWVEVKGASRPLFIEDSTSFAKMSEADFTRYLDEAATVITKHWLRGVPVETLMKEAA